MSGSHVWRDNARLTSWCIGLLYAQAALAVAALWSGWLELGLFDRIEAGSFETEAEFLAAADANDFRDGLIVICQSVAAITGGILILVWIYRANANLRSRGVKLYNSPGWAVGWFFVPIANFWKPFGAMRDLWKGSTSPEDWQQAQWPIGLFATWWTLWLASILVSNAAFRQAMRIEGISDLRAMTQFYIALDLASIPLCLIFPFIMHGIETLQQEMHRSVSQAPAGGS